MARDLALIPSKEAVDRIHWYETANVRTPRKVEQWLEDMQAQRKQDVQAGLKSAGDCRKPEHK